MLSSFIHKERLQNTRYASFASLSAYSASTRRVPNEVRPPMAASARTWYVLKLFCGEILSPNSRPTENRSSEP